MSAVNHIKRFLLAYSNVVPPVLVGFVQLYLFNLIDISQANGFFSSFAAVTFLNGLLAFNTNYIYITRFATLSSSDSISEFKNILKFRFFTACFVSTPLLLFLIGNDAVMFVGIMFCKIIQEALLNYYRASDNLNLQLRYNIRFFIGEISLFIAIWYCFSKNISIVLAVLIANLILTSTIGMHGWRLLNFTSNNDSFRGFLKTYAPKCSPLILSSLRENLIGSGLIFVGSLVFIPPEFTVFNFSLKIYRTGGILFSALSNFYVQDISRGRHSGRLLYLVYIFVFLFYITLCSVMSYANEHIHGVFNAELHLIFGIIISVFVCAYYFTLQFNWILNNQLQNVYLFELISIALIILMYFASIYIPSALYYAVFIAHIVPIVILKRIGKKYGNAHIAF